MTDHNEKPKPKIQTRTPGRLAPKGGMFDRVKLRESPHPIEEILAAGGEHFPAQLPAQSFEHIESPINESGTTDSSGSTEFQGNTIQSGNTDLSGSTGEQGNTAKSSTTTSSSSTSLISTTNISGTTRISGKSKRPGQDGVTRTPTRLTAVAPERDFQRVPNSVTREAMAARLFRGKSKQVWDYLWSKSRGAIAPSRTVRRSRPQIKSGAGFGSMSTVDAAVEHLQSVGLLAVKIIVGENGGNEYEVFTPEEVAAGLFGLPNSIGSTDKTGSTETTQNPVVPVVPESGSTGSTPISTGSDVSGEFKTSSKTIEKSNDDEAFTELIDLLKQASKEVTGKGSPIAEAGRWKEVGELLVAELKQGAARTSVSSAPAFLAEHLRRRLNRQPALPPAAKAPTAIIVPPAPRPEPPTDDELIEMFTGFLHQGMTLEDLDGQLSASIDPERWPHIRQAAVERYEAEKARVVKA